MGYYKMMINNAKQYLKNVDVLSDDCIDGFKIAEVLSICTGKLKEDILIDLIKN